MNLELVGVVSRSFDPYIARPTWLRLIEEYGLQTIRSFVAVNPFTGDPIKIGGPTGEPAALVRGKKQVGVVVWRPAGEGLELYGDPGEMGRVGRAIAKQLRGEFEVE